MLKVLKRRSQFSTIKKNGKRFFSDRWLLINYLSNPNLENSFEKASPKEIQVGWTISKKVGKAVVRNKLKRWCREYFREDIKKNSYDFSMHVNIVLRKADKGLYKSIRRECFLEKLNEGWIEVVKKNQKS